MNRVDTLESGYPYSRFLSRWTPWILHPMVAVFGIVTAVAVPAVWMRFVAVLFALSIILLCIPPAKRNSALARNGGIYLTDECVEIFETEVHPVARFQLTSVLSVEWIAYHDPATDRGEWTPAWYRLVTSEGSHRFLAHPKDDLLDTLRGWVYRNRLADGVSQGETNPP